MHIEPRVSVNLGTSPGATVCITEGTRGEVKRKRHLFRMRLYSKFLELKSWGLIFVPGLVYFRAFYYSDTGLRS